MSNHKHRETQAIISYEKASLYGDRTKHRDGRESNHNTKTDTMDHCNVSNETASEYGGGGNERLWLWGAWRLWWRLRWRRIWEVMVVVTSDGWWERWRWLWERAMLVMTSVTVVLATPVKTYLRSEGSSDERWRMVVVVVVTNSRHVLLSLPWTPSLLSLSISSLSLS